MSVCHRQRCVNSCTNPGISLTPEQVLEIMTVTGSVGGVMVWASQCLAFIGYYRWLRKWVSQLPEYYDRWATPRLEWQTKRPFLSSGQPVVAWVGLIGCLLIVFVLSTARWWNGSYTVGKVATAFAGVSLETASSVSRELANLSSAYRPVCDICCSKANPADPGHRG